LLLETNERLTRGFVGLRVYRSKETNCNKEKFRHLTGAVRVFSALPVALFSFLLPEQGRGSVKWLQ
jgi:hypothetical protein